MPQQTVTFRVCSACGGVIPPDAGAIEGVSGRLAFPGGRGQVQDFSGMDFCSTEHMAAFLSHLPVVETPNPLYAPPEGNVAPHVPDPPAASMVENIPTEPPAAPEPPKDEATGATPL